MSLRSDEHFVVLFHCFGGRNRGPATQIFQSTLVLFDPKKIEVFFSKKLEVFSLKKIEVF